MQRLDSLTALNRWQGTRKGERVALVPTMGNLHAGHLALVRQAATLADRVVVSIYVNPTQFGPNEDFSRYPRTLNADLAKLESLSVDAVFLPDEAMIYPFGVAESMTFQLPESYAGILCGKGRPGHFQGVVAVVSRLFLLIRPEMAVFGAKDFQQQWILRRMVADLHFPVKIVTGETVREPDGLAMSSRNQYLNEVQRQQAPAIQATLQQSAEKIRAGQGIEHVLARAWETLVQAGLAVEYFDCRDQATLQAADKFDRPLVLFAAARLGNTRLIDNFVLDFPG